MIKEIFNWSLRRSTCYDALFLSLLAVWVTWNPYYLHQTLNVFELGLYLPGIDGILHGQVPYRDFFHLRGPFELYLPAFIMHFCGEHVAVLATYFYIGNVLTLIICVWLAHGIYPSRLLLYSMVPVVITRTFPRVVFTYWGGMRYTWGLLAIFCLVWFLKKDQKRWLIMAGLLAAVAGFTSMEIGFSILIAFMAVVVLDARRPQVLSLFLLGVGIIAVPYLFYLSTHNALGDYINAQGIVATQMSKTFVQTEPVPSSIGQFFHALFIVKDKNFRQLTPVYCYVACAGYLFWRRWRGQLTWTDKAATIIALYGLTIYWTGFRNLWANVFEMALQPEKIILFYLWAQLILYLFHQHHYKKISYVLMSIVVSSSLVYGIIRFYKRFLAFHHQPVRTEISQMINLPRMKSMEIPQRQAEDFIQLKEFLDANTSSNEAVWMYPELGTLHFVLDRPWIGKFPTATLAWMDEKWYAYYMSELIRLKPRYAIVNKKTPDYFERSYFPVSGNQEKFQSQMDYLKTHYFLVVSSPTYNIYRSHN